MARPPIIISNGGVRDKLTIPGKSLLECIKDLNLNHATKASWIDSNDLNHVPLILWHLKNEKEADLNRLLRTLYPKYKATVGKEIK